MAMLLNNLYGHLVSLTVWLIAVCGSVDCLLPSINPHAFARNEVVPIEVNVLTSLRTHLPYDYYKALPTCRPKEPISKKSNNIGGSLMGDRIKTSPYENIRLLSNVSCSVVCEKGVDKDKQTRFLKKAIEKNYRINLLMDGLPLAEASGNNNFVMGVPLGFMRDGRSYVNNHIHFTISYTPDNVKQNGGEEKYRILTFVAEASSVAHKSEAPCAQPLDGHLASNTAPLPADTDRIIWSYGVSWIESKEKWSTRWDIYLSVHKEKTHWYSIMNSTLLVIFLTIVIAVLLVRIVRRDLGKLADVDIDETEYLDDIGWKLLCRDVFRPPPNGWLLACFTGAGVQLLGMSFTVVVFATMGFFSPQNRGSLFTALLVCFALLGVTGGYVSARLLKLWNRTKWMYVFLTGTIVPASSFAIFFVVNLLVWSQSSSAAVPFSSVALVVCIWFFVSLPLVYFGAVLGFKQGTISVPSNYNQIPRHIPAQPWYSSTLAVLSAGVPPFAVVFFETYFILGAIWLNRFYYIFGFLFLVGVLFVIITAETAIVFIYYSLCAEDHRWWWKSFFIGSSSGLYLFLYTLYYATEGSVKIEGMVPTVLYVGYMGLLSFLFSVAAGSVGFLACFLFVRWIYRYGKAD
ncbi:endosomal integral membrane protein, putative [Trypanosoma brucei gambiense DAL972]|uniref:Transmembrane 9 superfamily member n=1 Tax=Trypanosoma brucei gambiense (strain MHOM/CI/86/DAL972) TaxID=679716 RepID=C9ZUX0_TRYB9|nr:endosomal integral membrane protein, putative [Trypanosoma brucei gambiense DAL972]CBH13208.1 endosomal integral membrane protein, putative [Trypanosoma brucei gambiense DAL972]|eukprot:XP_011775485.1 endosomal integral membrane protein, putative [Trypanosoma brucei gambiense DAL972]